MEEMKFCQSCAMPMTKAEEFGNNADGSPNTDYCCYCYKDGEFTSQDTLEQFIEKCIPFAIESGVYPDEDTARAQMQGYYPTLKRWSGRENGED